MPPSLLKRKFIPVLEARLREKAPLIQVILGPRQVGKTTGIQMLGLPAKTLHYATADDSISLSPEWITEQWQTAKLLGPSPILVIDEIQKILHWSERIKALWDAEKRKKGTLKVVLLGSSSLSLQKGLEESMTGRFETIHVPHWSFDESREQFGFDLDDYLIYGGYPEAARFQKNHARWQTYLKKSIIETVVGKDILRLSSVRNPTLFRQTFDLLAGYPAQEISYTKLLGQLQERGNTDLVKHYIELLEGAFLFKALQKYSGSLVRQKASSPKIIPLCPALYSYRMHGKELLDPEIRGHLFEAAVGAELTQLPGDLFYWRDARNAEVDFIYVAGRDVFAIEVKSGRRKSAHGLSAFLKLHPKAAPIFITPENFPEFSRDPQKMIDRLA